MSRPIRAVFSACAALLCAAASAAVVPPPSERFGHLIVHDPSALLGTVAVSPEAIPAFEEGRAAWNAFRAEHGSAWRIFLDRRSGVPLLVDGPGIAWIPPGTAFDASRLEGMARRFVLANAAALAIRETELVFNPRGSGAADADHLLLVFDRAFAGVPVEGESLTFFVTRGRLSSFGANRWGPIDAVPEPVWTADSAFEALRAYMGLRPEESVEIVEVGTKILLPVPPAGFGIDHRLAWRFGLRVPGEAGTWVGKVDALTGRILAFFDDDRYAAVKGGIYPLSNDQVCSQSGCELDGFPMPYVDVSLGKKRIATGDMGVFICGRGPKNATANFSGPYVTVQDTCGLASGSGNCSGDLDFGSGPGTDCAVPSGQGAGDTHAGRTSYYHLNRIKEKARHWLPANGWVNQTLTDKVNTVATCNAFWNGSVNFYRSGGGCRNTGEIPGVIHHEYGHGLDQNDGGGYDNPSEGYADVVAILSDRVSCVGRGFFQNGNCSGYGDTCLACSGIREMDWDRRIRHTPATPANFTATNCGGGSGPCGRAVHCESYVVAETIFDLATRDLPASGIDAFSSWQLAERLFYRSRQGSGGNAFNCALPNSDGCGASSWFHKMRNADDDDGNLANGTPHAAAIYAAFSRHGIACGASTDPSNQSASSCPSIGSPAISAAAGAGAVTVSWAAVPGASSYLILRSDLGCDATANVVGTVAAPGASFVDDELPPGFPVHYRVQAVGSNAACEGAVSACAVAAAQ